MTTMKEKPLTYSRLIIVNKLGNITF